MVLNRKAIDFLERDEYAVQIAADNFEFYLFIYDADSGIEVSDTNEEP